MQTELKRYLTLPVLMSPTRGELSVRCHRRHVLSDRFHLHKGERSPALSFGDVFHKARDVFWQTECDAAGWPGVGRLQALDAALSTAHDVWDVVDGSYHTLDLMTLLLQQYAKEAKLAGNLPGRWRLHTTEQRRALSFKVGDAVAEIRYKIDAIIENEVGELAIVDTKTASQLSPRWREGHSHSVQPRAYKTLENQRLSDAEESARIQYVLIEGVQKKGVAGIVEYVWADALWTPEYEEEALELLLARASRDLPLLDAFSELERTIEDPGKRYEAALKVALTEPQIVDFNQQDCNAYYYQCEYYDLCYGCPSDRLGLALSDYEVQISEY